MDNSNSNKKLKLLDSYKADISKFLNIKLPQISSAQPQTLSRYIFALLKKEMTYDEHKLNLCKNLKLFIKTPEKFVGELLNKLRNCKKRKREEDENIIEEDPDVKPPPKKKVKFEEKPKDIQKEKQRIELIEKRREEQRRREEKKKREEQRRREEEKREEQRRREEEKKREERRREEKRREDARKEEKRREDARKEEKLREERRIEERKREDTRRGVRRVDNQGFYENRNNNDRYERKVTMHGRNPPYNRDRRNFYQPPDPRDYRRTVSLPNNNRDNPNRDVRGPHDYNNRRVTITEKRPPSNYRNIPGINLSNDNNFPPNNNNNIGNNNVDSEKEKKTLVVSNIPQDKLDKNIIVDYFSKFGVIDKILVDVVQKKSFITFNKNEEAQAAYVSPDAILSNRFVKVSYYFPKKEPKRIVKKINIPIQKPVKKKRVTFADNVSTIRGSKSKIEMINTLIKQNKEIITMLTSLPQDKKEEIQLLIKKSNSITSTIEKLQKEQKEKLSQSKQWLNRKKTQKNIPVVFKLDNRPTSLKVLNWPLEMLDKSIIKNHFKFYGYIVNIDIENDHFILRFSDRKSAEKALKFGKRFRGVDLSMTWHQISKKVPKKEEEIIEEQPGVEEEVDPNL